MIRSPMYVCCMYTPTVSAGITIASGMTKVEVAVDKSGIGTGRSVALYIPNVTENNERSKMIFVRSMCS